MFDTGEMERLLEEECRLVDVLDAADRAETVAYCRKLATVLSLRRIAEDAGRGSLAVVAIAATLRVTEQSARMLLDNADASVRHPDVFDLAREGRLRVAQLLAALDALRSVVDERSAEVERLALDAGLEDRTPSEIRALIRRLAIRLDARAAARARERAVADRSVAMFPGEDGVGTLWALLPADVLVRVYETLTEMAVTAGRLFPSDPRTRDQWRADLLAEAVLSQVPAEVRAKTPAVQAVIEIPVTVASDLADAPVDLVGFGSIDPAYARLLLPACDLCPAYVDAITGEHLTSADGLVRAPGSATAGDEAALKAILADLASRPFLDDDTPEPGYRPSRKLARRVRRRDRTCTFFGCSCGSRRCDLDHEIPWPAGPTRAANLAPKSRRHHRAKQAGWRSSREPGGGISWTAPTGHRYRRRALKDPPPPLRDVPMPGSPEPDPPCPF